MKQLSGHHIWLDYHNFIEELQMKNIVDISFGWANTILFEKLQMRKISGQLI